MFLPVHDKNALRFIPFQIVTVSLIVINVGVFLWQQTLTAQDGQAVTLGAGFIPASLMGTATIPAEYAFMPVYATLFTYMFLHGSWLHLIGNMLFLWVFGDNVEDAMGHVKFLIFYILCGICGALAHGFAEPSSGLPMIGASGAVAGIIGAYLLLYPKAKVWAAIFRFPIPFAIRAYLLLTFWLAFQLYFIATGGLPETAWWAHLGGFVAGAFLILFMRRKEAKLFGPYQTAESSEIDATA